MATCTENATAVDAYNASLYPEVLIDNPDAVGTPAVTIADTMDFLATKGRLAYHITLITESHGPALKAALEDDLTGTGYKVTCSATQVIVACSSC